jgi:hypothetical protein
MGVTRLCRREKDATSVSKIQMEAQRLRGSMRGCRRPVGNVGGRNDRAAAFRSSPRNSNGIRPRQNASLRGSSARWMAASFAARPARPRGNKKLEKAGVFWLCG